MHRWIRKLLITVMIVSMILTTVSCSSDTGLFGMLSSELRGNGQRQPSARNLTAHQLVQKMADTIRNRSDVAATFSSIPEKQRGSVSLDLFQQYIALLTRGVAGSIVSFSPMTEDEFSEIQAIMNERVPGQKDQIETLNGFWIHTKGVGQSEGRFAVFVEAKEGEVATLAGWWVEQLIALQQFSVLYFDALSGGDQEALAALLKETDLPASIIDIRAARLIDFYRNNINSRPDEFRLTHARIDSIGFEEFGIINPDRSQSVSRSIEILQTGSGLYQVQDVLPEKIQISDLQILYDDKLLMTFGQIQDGEDAQIRSGELESIIGESLLHDNSVCTTAPNGVQRINLQYRSLRLKAEGTCFRHSRWSGTITEIELVSTKCSTGSGLRPGDSLERLLEQYPFALESNLIMSGETPLGRVQLRFKVEDDVIQSIVLSH